MSRHFLPQKYKSFIRYLLIVLAFAVLVLGVYMYFKYRIKMMERENEPGFPTATKIIGGDWRFCGNEKLSEGPFGERLIPGRINRHCIEREKKR